MPSTLGANSPPTSAGRGNAYWPSRTSRRTGLGAVGVGGRDQFRGWPTDRGYACRALRGSLSRSSIEGMTLAETGDLLRVSAEQLESVLPERLREEFASGQARWRFVQFSARRQGRVYVEDIDNFAEVRAVDPSRVTEFLRDGKLDRSEEAIRVALESILGVAFHKVDWGGEGNDLYTSNVLVKGVRTPTAFLLKGRGLKKRTMEVSNCGKNGDQVMRLFQSPASLFVIQYVGNISEAVIRHAEGEIARLRQAGQDPVLPYSRRSRYRPVDACVSEVVACQALP